MKRVPIYVFYLIVVACLFSCHNTPFTKKNKIVCTDSSYHATSVDMLKGYEIRTEAKLIQMQNFYLFVDAKHFEKVFTPSADMTPTPIDFSQYIVFANIIDNRLGAVVKGEASTVPAALLLHTDTCYIKNCELNIPFYVARMNTDTIPMERLAESYLRKCFLFRLPRKSGLTAVFFNNPHGISCRIDLSKYGNYPSD